MNTIIVNAYGAPGSFVRCVQTNPSIAIDLMDALKFIAAHDPDKCLIPFPHDCLAYVRDLAQAVIEATNGIVEDQP